MDQAEKDLATLIYLAIELECDGCHKRFSEREDKAEAEGWWKWAEKVAADAYLAGWREVGGKQLCSDCFSSCARTSA